MPSSFSPRSRGKERAINFFGLKINLQKILATIKKSWPKINDPRIGGVVCPPGEVELGALPLLLGLKEDKDVIFVTQKSLEKQISEMGFKYASSLDEAIEIAYSKHKEAKLSVLPNAAQTLPILS